MNSCNYTNSQQQFVKKIRTFLEGEQDFFVLKGSAGAGKTFMMCWLAQSLFRSGRAFQLMAPTGRAAKVLSDKTGFSASTIHKAIYSMDDIKEYKILAQDGSETYKYYFDLALNDDDARTVYIVDESSMVSDIYSEAEFMRFGSGHLLKDMIEYVNQDANDHGKKIIFVGDSAQLPPVNSSISPALNSLYIEKEYGLKGVAHELLEVVRQKEGSGILSNATSIRDCIREQKYNVLAIDVNHSDVEAIEPTDVLDCYLKASSCPDGEDGVLIVAQSNQRVKSYNDLIRAHKFPGQDDVCIGDRVLVVHNNYLHETTLLNGDFGEVKNVECDVERRTVFLNKPVDGKRVNVPVELVFRKITLRFKDSSGVGRDIRCNISENLLGSHERNLTSDENKALYIDFKNRNKSLKPGTPAFKEKLKNDEYFNCLRIKYGYAATCHKAQGGEWDNVIVDFSSTVNYFCEDYFRWAYTAITRAQNHLYGLNTPNFGIARCLKTASLDNLHFGENIISVAYGDIEKEDSFETVDGMRWLDGLYHRVSAMVAVLSCKVSSVNHKNYCEHYTFGRGEANATAFIYYNAKNKITNILWKPGSDETLERELQGVLKAFTGKAIIVEEKSCHDNAVHHEIPDGPDYLRDFYEEICIKAGGEDVEIVTVNHLSQYHVRYCFKQRGHEALVNYYFKGNGRLSSINIDEQKTTSETLADLIVGFGS